MSGKIENVAIVGAGVLGTQIALQAAYHGCDVTTFDLNPKSFDQMLGVIETRLRNSGRPPFPAFAAMDEVEKKVRRHGKLADALEGRQLIIEAVREDVGIKREVFGKIDRLAPKEAILATNSSSIPISRIESATGRPEKCLNIHFYSLDLGRNIVDLMGGTKTAPETLAAAKDWVRSIGCIPLTVKKEILGFCFNRIWRAVKRDALHMWADGYVDYRDIDRGWMVWTGMAAGPFGFMDNVGLDVVYDIETVYYNESKDPRDRPPAALKEMIDRQDLGVKTGRGFYRYPDPEYRRPEFLSGEEED